MASAGVVARARSRTHSKRCREPLTFEERRSVLYHAELGDFSSAGGVHIRTFDRMPENQFSLGIGEDGFARGLVMGTVDVGSLYVSGALEGQVPVGGDRSHMKPANQPGSTTAAVA